MTQICRTQPRFCKTNNKFTNLVTFWWSVRFHLLHSFHKRVIGFFQSWSQRRFSCELLSKFVQTSQHFLVSSLNLFSFQRDFSLERNKRLPIFNVAKFRRVLLWFPIPWLEALEIRELLHQIIPSIQMRKCVLSWRFQAHDLPSEIRATL